MALPEKEKKQLMILLIIAALGGGGAYYMLWWQPHAETLTTAVATADSMQLKVDSAKAQLARGSVEALRQKVADMEGTLGLMRRLVPSGNDVPNLIDDISNRAKRRGVAIASFTPRNTEEAPPFQIYKYGYTVFGHYDDVAAFLSDVASLPRIMVPYDVKLEPAKSPAMKAYADTTGALLEVSFEVRTFVKAGTSDSTATAASGGQE
jgi:type IV pilus assembly protein PilO